MNTYLYDHRKIYERLNGPIPLGYEIHHIDGNHKNNDPKNLKAVTMQEHYDIHYQQGDWHAAHLIGIRLKLPADFLGDLQRKRVVEGTHHWLGGALAKKLNRRRINEGTHHFLGSGNNQKRLLDGTHPTQTKISCIFCKKICNLNAFGRYHKHLD